MFANERQVHRECGSRLLLRHTPASILSAEVYKYSNGFPHSGLSLPRSWMVHQHYINCLSVSHHPPHRLIIVSLSVGAAALIVRTHRVLRLIYRLLCPPGGDVHPVNKGLITIHFRTKRTDLRPTCNLDRGIARSHNYNPCQQTVRSSDKLGVVSALNH